MAPSCWMTSGSNVVPSISAAFALPASAARRSKSRAATRSPRFKRIRAAVDERGDLLGVEVPGRVAFLRPRRLRPEGGRSSSLSARHL